MRELHQKQTGKHVSSLQWLAIWLGIGAVYIFKDWDYGKKKYSEAVKQFGGAIKPGVILAFVSISAILALIFWPLSLAWDIADNVRQRKNRKEHRD
jgi:hypothetical protein